MFRRPTFLAFLILSACGKPSANTTSQTNRDPPREDTALVQPRHDLSCFEGRDQDNPEGSARGDAAKQSYKFYYLDWGGGMSILTPGVSLSQQVYVSGKHLIPIGSQPFRGPACCDTSAEMTPCEKAFKVWAARYNIALCPFADAAGVGCKRSKSRNGDY